MFSLRATLALPLPSFPRRLPIPVRPGSFAPRTASGRGLRAARGPTQALAAPRTQPSPAGDQPAAAARQVLPFGRRTIPNPGETIPEAGR